MNEKLYDPIRKQYILKKPEEIVRQKLILKMTQQLGFPKSLIAIEKDLKALPHLQNFDFSSKKRRADIICFAKNIHPKYLIFPLIVIECKSGKLTKDAIDQVIGYNHFINAYFISIANEKKITTFWYDFNKKKYQSIEFLPSYKKLLDTISISF